LGAGKRAAPGGGGAKGQGNGGWAHGAPRGYPGARHNGGPDKKAPLFFWAFRLVSKKKKGGTGGVFGGTPLAARFSCRGPRFPLAVAMAAVEPGPAPRRFARTGRLYEAGRRLVAAAPAPARRLA